MDDAIRKNGKFYRSRENEDTKTGRGRRLEKFFHDESETLIAVLGQGYITSLMQGVLKKGVLFLSDRRLYQEGKIFQRSASGQYMSKKGSSVVSVKDITGYEFQEVNDPWRVILGVIFALLGIVFLAISASENAEGLAVSSVITIFLSILFLISYFTKRMRLFTVKFAGGEISVDCRWYSESELRTFQKAISRMKDKETNKSE